MAPWRIQRIVPGGEGFARLDDGRVGFARGVAPGDVIEPTALDERKRFVRATAWELLEAGPDRIEPPCQYAARCGGCDLMHLALPAQHAQKRALIEDALRRTGGLREIPPFALHGEGPALGYRRRLRLHASADGRIGLYAAGTHELVDIQACAVSDAAINALLPALRRALGAAPHAARALDAIELRSSPDGVALSLLPRRDNDTTPLRALADALAPHAAVSIAGVRAAEAPAPERLALTDATWLQAPPGVFTQINWEVNRRIVADVVAQVTSAGAERVLDLYAGAGNFSLPLAATGAAVLGVENDPRAVRAARAAAQAQGIASAHFVHDDAARRARALLEQGKRFDTVLCDPPRTGAKEALDAIATLAQRQIAYVSCDPVTLARDLDMLHARGWALRTLAAYDMFPHTHHVELFATLAK